MIKLLPHELLLKKSKKNDESLFVGIVLDFQLYILFFFLIVGA